MDKKQVLERIEQLMIEKGITRYQLKENIEVSSIIYQWKKNPKRDESRIPSLRSIDKICSFFGVSLSYFFAFDKDEEKSVLQKELSAEISKLNEDQIRIIENLVRQFQMINNK